MSRFSRLFARGSSVRFASATVAAAMFASLLMLPNTASAQGLLQAPNPSLTTGTTPQAVAAADFARTGWIGLVVANSNISRGASTISVFLGNGPNTYAPGHTYTVCENPTSVLATDINHDGYPDIIVGCGPNSGAIDVLLNSGTGTFGAATSYTLSSNPVALVAGDFVGNGYVDVASADSNGNVSILLNTTGNGTFTLSHSGVTGTLSGIAAGDFNKDGHLDLAVSDSANSKVHTLINSGTGTFTEDGTGYTTGAGSKPSGIVAADFNQDGNMDVATSNAGTNTAIVLLGNGTGALTAKTAQATGTDPIALVTTDVNSDGYPDLVAFDELSTSTGAVAVLLGNGDGTLEPAQTSSQAFLPGTQATVADFNRDGKPDIALTQPGNQTVSVMLNNTLPTQYPDGRSSAAYNPLSIGAGNFADSVAVGDFNKDGNLDVAVSYLQDNDVKVLFGNGSGSFTAGATYTVGSQPYWIASGDLNGDGYPDLVTANTNVTGATGTVTVLLNNKNGTFTASPAYTVGKEPYQVAIGDVNGDGHPDLAVTNYGANTVTILFGSSTGTFTVQPTTLDTCADPFGVAIGDFKHNGFPSVAVTCYSSSQLEIFPNNGNGTFGTPYMYTVYDSYSSLTPNPESLVVGDFNRDGKLDIVVGNSNANNISFFAGNGDNTFVDSMESAPSLNHPASIAAGDFNGDGILDIVGVAPNYNAVDLTLGVGDGTFGTIAQRAAGQFTAKTQPWGLAVGDFNNDGQLDIVTANTFHQVALDSPANQTRYMTAFPATPGGNPSVDVLLNASAAAITVTSSPSPVPANNTDVTVKASVQPAYSGSTPTGSVIFENSSGTVVGTGPYELVDGVATYSLGHVGSGSSYLFTSLYSGDSNFQPTTVSGSGASFTVPGTPVTLSLSPSTVDLGNSFVATVTAIGNTTTGSYPHGTATIYIDTGTGTPIAIGTTTAFAQVGDGHNSSRTITITATAANNLPIGSYQLYAVFNPTSGNYTQGSSSDEPLTVIPVPPTPITLALNPSTVPLGNSFVATVTATGNTTAGSYPQGTASIYIDTGGTPILIGTTAAFQEIGGGNNSSRTITIAATAANHLPVGSYQLYAVFNPTNPPNYASGTSVDEPLTVTAPLTPTSTTVSCTGGLFGGTCTSTTTVTATGAPVSTGNTVNYSGAGSGSETTNAAGQTTWSYSAVIGSYTITASFPAQGIYAASSNTTNTFCFIVCGLDRSSGSPVTFNSFTGADFNNGFGSPNANNNAGADRNNGFGSQGDSHNNGAGSNNGFGSQNDSHNNGANQRSMPFTLF